MTQLQFVVKGIVPVILVLFLKVFLRWKFVYPFKRWT